MGIQHGAVGGGVLIFGEQPFQFGTLFCPAVLIGVKGMVVGALYREASKYCFMLRIGLLFSERHLNTKRIWSAFSFINRLRTTSAGLSSPAMCSNFRKE